MSATDATREPVPYRRAFRGRDERIRCQRHGKVLHPSEEDAQARLIEITRGGTHDPGLVVYECKSSGAWHTGHPGGWRSLGRLIEEGQSDRG